MRSILFVLFFILCLPFVQAQQPFKTIKDQPYVVPQPLQVTRQIETNANGARTSLSLSKNQIASLQSRHESISRVQITPSGSMWMELTDNKIWELRSSIDEVVRTLLSSPVQEEPMIMTWEPVSEQTDENQVEHIRVQQKLAGVPVKGQEVMLHIKRGQINALNGLAWTGPLPKTLPAPLPATEAMQAAITHLQSNNVKFQPIPSFPGLVVEDNSIELIWVPSNGKLILSYIAGIHPNALDHWTVYVNASTLEIIEAISQKCSISPYHLFETDDEVTSVASESSVAHLLTCSHAPLMDGATTTTDQDLLGQNRTVNGYQVGTTFYLIDASRTGMFQPTQSVLPNEPSGVIWTVDAKNSSPTQTNFEVFHATNANNNWQNLEVSAHYNAGKAYEYFLNTFGRNSINGNGGNIISIINVTDDNDNDMDNAFWNGSAMFYGNGDTQYKELARGLDVGGHEMSHGVIQNTANLEYIGQSGALNESYADVFGAMIDRDDWLLGEDVVLLSAFPSGALRNMENPNNGGTQLGHPGWQPKHMNEFVSLPNTPENDNGGVHINSGIPNRAFFLLATSIGKEKAEQIYYKALRDYLVKSSQFVDMRLAAEKASIDLHGNNSPELDAVRAAFNTVGIGGGQGGDYEEDIEANLNDFIIATDASYSDLYWIPPTNPTQFVKMDVPAPISRPSFTDDGSSCVYIDNEQNMILINFNWAAGLSYQAFYLEDNPQGIWRNIVVSKDGSKIAYTTANLRNEIHVFDFVGGGTLTYELYNPTTAPGVATGDVLYADAMEWDYSGAYVMYDALNRIESNFGDGIEYWDISFLEAWNTATEDFGTGIISELFSTLPENISVGNPTFAKNSPYIIAFDFAESYFDNFGNLQTDYWVIAANIEAGTANNIYQNTTIGYPSYSRLDNKILFTYDDFGQILLATINVQPTDKTLPVPGTDVLLIEGAQQGVWFVTGTREFTGIKDLPVLQANMVRPQPATDYIEIINPQANEGAAYQIIDVLGRITNDGTLDASKSIGIHELPSGTYVIRLKIESGRVYTSRFVKQ